MHYRGASGSNCVVADRDLHALTKHIRDEAELLRHVAREADMEIGEVVAAARRKRGELDRAWDDAHPGSDQRGAELGEDRRRAPRGRLTSS